MKMKKKMEKKRIEPIISIKRTFMIDNNHLSNFTVATSCQKRNPRQEKRKKTDEKHYSKMNLNTSKTLKKSTTYQKWNPKRKKRKKLMKTLHDKLKACCYTLYNKTH